MIPAITILFFLLMAVYYYIPLSLPLSFEVLITVSTFSFAVLAGFFIQRQGQRYTQISDQLAQFDGELSAMYRSFGHFGLKAQKEDKKNIAKHYNKILKEDQFNYYITHKTSTIKYLSE